MYKKVFLLILTVNLTPIFLKTHFFQLEKKKRLSAIATVNMGLVKSQVFFSARIVCPSLFVIQGFLLNTVRNCRHDDS